jgi:periplasmic protein TonB
VLAHNIARSSGYADLDNEVMAMIMRAQPLPPFPANMAQPRIDLTVPIRFSLR